MSTILGILTFFGILAVAILTIAAVIMPLVVIVIDHRISNIARILAAMEDMMRNGK